jgi:hypothetical protein
MRATHGPGRASSRGASGARPEGCGRPKDGGMSGNPSRHGDPERARLAAADLGVPWRLWGPYLSERQWGTVREDYSAGGEAWDHLPHDHARSRAYRWGEDGLAGICDDGQRLCFALAFWNGVDPILKERIFGLGGGEGNHGEDAKEYWWYIDATPTASWLRWQYVYPQRPFPYDDLLAENRRRGRRDLEYELLDTGVFDGDRYWDVTVDYAKAAERDICIAIRVRNAGPEPAVLDVLPTLWFRNTWSWDGGGGVRPSIRADGGRLVAEHPELGTYRLDGEVGGEPLLCENETNAGRLFGAPGTPYPKDGIGDHVVLGRPTVNPAGVGTRAALRYRVPAEAGETKVLRLRLTGDGSPAGATWEDVMRARRAESDDFYAALTPADASADEALVMRQAFAGMIWGQQVYLLDVERWLDGDPGQPPPPEGHDRRRNADWRHLNVADVISMPDKWEYPWFASWDLAFHAIALAHVDPSQAKRQLLLMCREWYMHPSGQLPAYEWEFGDVNPPVQPLAALRVYDIDGRRDHDFLERMFHKLLINFTWWVNRKDAEGNNLFEGGFLGLDNIGPFDRSRPLPRPLVLEQSDGTAWMAVYCLGMLYMALVLAEADEAYRDVAVKFLDHFTYVASAINRDGIWHEEDGFYYDRAAYPDGGEPVRVRSIVGLLPLVAVAPMPAWLVERVPDLVAHLRWFLANRPRNAPALTVLGTIERREALLAVVSPAQLERLLARMLDAEEFLSPYGIRALSRHHREHPFEMELAGQSFRVDYEPAESTTPLFGGNSNWRGPVWFPVNYLLVGALRRYDAALGPGFTVEHPTGSGRRRSLFDVAEDLSGRLVSIFLDDERRRRPVFGGIERFQRDPAWHDRLLFHEYFHGDCGAGLGASHQTGWTGLVADLIADRPRRRADRARRAAAHPAGGAPGG